MFWAVTPFFAPVNAPIFLDNLDRFASSLRRQGVPLLVVELAFGDAPFSVPQECADRIVRLRSDTVLWHKERLINIGIEHLPPDCRHVAWLDGDVVFENESWASQALSLLERFTVVQLFETVCWLQAGERLAPASLPVGIGEGHQLDGFAATLDRLGPDPEARRRTLMDYRRHGCCGLAWAARREFLVRHGLYDRAILGGGDVIHAHAFAADHDYIRGRGYLARYLAPRERVAVGEWGRAVGDDTGGRMGWVPGRASHLFHGPWQFRQYDTRGQLLKDAGFDPVGDISPDDSGCWRWNTDKPDLHRRVVEYFAGRAPSLDAPGGTDASSAIVASS
jgi:hypothetical protein